MVTNKFCCPCWPVFGFTDSMVGTCAGLTVIVTLELPLNWESLPVRVGVYTPRTYNVAEALTGLICSATSGKVTVELSCDPIPPGLLNQTGPGPPVTLHVALSVAPMGSPSSDTLPFNVTVGPIMTFTMLFPCNSTNHTAPSGPAVIPYGWLLPVGDGNSVITPAGVILPILFVCVSGNQRLPSGPAVMHSVPL